mmetsp:Transcript_126973/g.367552  ORF Transcript_126973/g.367552 Transcript_126973/m.367552 type:complete len:227 (-) Transcript_126973:1900-2580(-)
MVEARLPLAVEHLTTREVLQRAHLLLLVLGHGGRSRQRPTVFPNIRIVSMLLGLHTDLLREVLPHGRRAHLLLHDPLLPLDGLLREAFHSSCLLLRHPQGHDVDLGGAVSRPIGPALFIAGDHQGQPEVVEGMVGVAQVDRALCRGPRAWHAGALPHELQRVDPQLADRSLRLGQQVDFENDVLRDFPPARRLLLALRVENRRLEHPTSACFQLVNLGPIRAIAEQ